MQLFLILHQLEICFLLKGPANLPTGNKPTLPMGGKVGGPPTRVGFVESLSAVKMGDFDFDRIVNISGRDQAGLWDKRDDMYKT